LLCHIVKACAKETKTAKGTSFIVPLVDAATLESATTMQIVSILLIFMLRATVMALQDAKMDFAMGIASNKNAY